MDLLPDIHADRIPRHIAIIMDGNGRWAVRQGKPRAYGHKQGMEQVRDVVTGCAELFKHRAGPEVLTLYSFSSENWKRPKEEVDFLMRMYVAYLKLERPTMMSNNIRFRQIGRMDRLPDFVLDEVERTYAMTAGNTGMWLVLALDYGSRAEITQAVKSLAADVAAGRLTAENIDEAAIASRLYTHDLPDVDLLIRTAGELRVSNYLLWQISYAELWVTDVLWPEFDRTHIHAAITAFAGRNRRFGALDHTNTLPQPPEDEQDAR